MQKQWMLLHLLNLVNVSATALMSCRDNRKIFTARQGTIAKGKLQHGASDICEFLIQGEPGESITLTFHAFHTECSYDHVFVHDGPSRSSKIIAVLTGSHDGKVLVSSSHSVFILLQSDDISTGTGINVTYSINSCPNNCSNQGNCVKNKCQCLNKRYGEACQLEWCPLLCSSNEVGNKCNSTSRKCMCAPGFYGEACSIPEIPNKNLDSWHNVTVSSDILKTRAGHVSAYVEQSKLLLVHGGYSLESVHDNLAVYNFSSNMWSSINIKDNGKEEPSARFGHAGISYRDTLIIFGGELSNGSYSNELWSYDCSSYTWKLLGRNPFTKGLKLHTMNLVKSCTELNEDCLFIFGGQDTNHSLISSDIYVYNLYQMSWSNPQHAYGKDLYLRVFGHSSVFYEDLNSLVIFGGFHAKVSVKPGELTNRLLLYHIKFRGWSTIKHFSAPKSPPPLAYHSAVVTGNYMIIFGGLAFNSSANKCPLTSTVYYYNLHCNTWVDSKSLIEESHRNWSPGVRFSHTAVIKNKQTLIIAGGYDHERILGDVIAYRLPKAVMFVDTKSQTELHGTHCVHYPSKGKCVMDPSCVFCLDGCVASTRKNRNKCGHNCHGICKHLDSCETCAIQTIHDNRNQDGGTHRWCKWCTLDRRCYDSVESGCQVSRSELGRCKRHVSGFGTGTWWKSSAGITILEQFSNCQWDNQTGLHMLQFNEKPNLDNPDGVKILKSTADISDYFENKLGTDAKKIIIRGIIFPYICYRHPEKCHHKVKLGDGHLGHVRADLYVANATSRRVVAQIPDLGRVDDRRIFPLPHDSSYRSEHLSYVLELNVSILRDKHPLKFLWNHTDGNGPPSFHEITPNYLQLYQPGACTNYTSCMKCITDAQCGWNHKYNNCLLLHKYWAKEGAEDQSVCLAREESQCVRCDDYFDCYSCLTDSFCVWVKYVGCKRKEYTRAAYIIKNISGCYPACRHYHNLTDCVKGVACVWCANKNICVTHYEYHLHNQFGQCYIFEQKAKKPCDNFNNSCKECMEQFKCGWFYNESDPRIGRCIKGDFSGPFIITSNVSNNDKTFLWKYDRCPDVNECQLGIHKCKNNSKCINTDGSYECKCNQGFEGDGKVFCKMMCWPKCVHGKCTKEITCQCDLGWKGKDCSIDCGCYNHSTCFNDTCDRCQNYTTGDHCQYCVNGAYGNATTMFGCKKCECNHHGDPLRNYCNRNVGTCFCVNNTVGKHCEKCLPNFSHSPKEYKYSSPTRICHLNCNRSTIQFIDSSGWLVASHAKNHLPFTTCLWVLVASKVTHDSLIYNQTKLNNSIILRLHRLKSSCSESHINIYDGIPPNPRTEKVSLKSRFKLLNSVCSLTSENRVYRSESGIFSILYEGGTNIRKDDLPDDQPTNELLAEYNLLSCPHSCPRPFVCLSDMRCVCKNGWHGALCEKEKCKNNCSSIAGGGTCNPISFECQCHFGFYGDDCSNQILHKQFSLEHINVSYDGIIQPKLERLGSSMVLHENILYVFGGSHFNDFPRPLFLQFNVDTNEWNKLDVSGRHPSSRYGHCSFVFDGYVYIYGGITKTGVMSDLWRYNIVKKVWEEMESLTRPLGGHSCTLVNQTVYIFGGYLPDEGLNEMPVKLDLNSLTNESIIFGKEKPQPKGLYSHIAVYDEVSENIYFHGGMAFFKEKVQLSKRIYAFNVRRVTWDYVEHLSNENVPMLVGHTGQLINGRLYIFGGYHDREKFNQNVHCWKVKCNRWITVKAEGNGHTDQMFLNSVNSNGSIYIFGGFNNYVSSAMIRFSIPMDICAGHQVKESCLGDDCHWCESGNYSVCYSGHVPSRCARDNAVVINNTNICHEKHSKNRECSSYTSCISCLASYPHLRSQCHWCRCSQESGVCRSADEPCKCKRHKMLNKCWEVLCEASSCWNCGNDCIWTNHLKYKSESKRILNSKGLEFNCFLKSLLYYLPYTAKYFHHRSLCPKGCHTYTNCRDCLSHESVYGNFAGTNYCMWSDKLSECLSIPILPIKCSFGHCGQLYVPNMKEECPAPCSSKTTCLSCIKSVGCGWCEQIGSKPGTCMKGDLVGPSKSKCGYLGNQVLPSIVNVDSTPYTWSYAMCPLKDECLEGVHECKNETEVCHDLEFGYSCLCKDGYKRTDPSKTCKPVCDGCVQGTCIKPDVCSCFFGWTGENCSVKCLCNGHSNCINATSNDICVQCFNNTQGKHCEECKPFFVGNPINEGTCTRCRSYCNGNAEFCVTNEEYKLLQGNFSVLKHITKGPKDSAVCVNCTNFSFGKRCEMCLLGYFRRQENTNCTKCRCNGHSHTCNGKTGLKCNCSHNTRTPTKEGRVYEQCSMCKLGYEGKPTEGRQCYKALTQSERNLEKNVENVRLPLDHTAYYFVHPKYLNLDLIVSIDIYQGEVDVYVTDANDRIFMVEDEVRNTHTLTLTDGLRNITEIKEGSQAVFSNFQISGKTLIIKRVKHRLVIRIPHDMQHDFRDDKFFIVLSSINKTKEDVYGTFYFRQDLVKLNLTLFFLTLIVTLMLVLNIIIVGLKLYSEYTRQRRGNEMQVQLQTLASRPFASYMIRCERNEDLDIIRKRKDRNTAGKNKFSNGSQNNNSSHRRITPLIVQNTEDHAASVITVMVQFPANNLKLASGIFQASSQHLIQVKSHVSHGRKVDIRILNTQT